MLAKLATAALGVLLITGWAEARAVSPATPSTDAARGNMTGKKERDMENCPSMVSGAETSMRDIKDGVELTIVASSKPERPDRPDKPDEPDDKKATDIRKLARKQAAIHPSGKKIEHTGNGTGGGKIGYCPIIHSGTHVTVTDIKGGVRIKMRATDPREVSELRDVARRRVDAIREKQARPAS
jgi:hypothetical protein